MDVLTITFSIEQTDFFVDKNLIVSTNELLTKINDNH